MSCIIIVHVVVCVVSMSVICILVCLEEIGKHLLLFWNVLLLYVYSSCKAFLNSHLFAYM